MNPFEIIDALEARSLVLWYDRRQRRLMSHDWAAFPDFLVDAITAARTELTRLIDRHGVRLGYHRIRFSYGNEGPWHVVVNRNGYLETLCRVMLAGRPIVSLAQSLPRSDPEYRNPLCQRCLSRQIARELERVADVTPWRDERGRLPL